MEIMLPTLREERRKTYSPVLPISPTSGGSCRCRSRCRCRGGHDRLRRRGRQRSEQSAFGGQAKLQWKVDWAMRWVALGVDYEMCGKDLIDSVIQSAQDRPRARRPPARRLQLRAVPRREGREDLQVQGQRPHHRGMARYGSEESLAFYIYREPKSAKSLHLGVIPRAVDEYWQFRANIPISRSSRSSATRSTTSTAARCPPATMP